MNTKVFINYRRDDTAPYAGRLYDRLAEHFGEDQVFIDIDQIEPGEDFVEVINRKVGACNIAIVAIGPNWLRATDASGKRRLDNEEDFVRMEIVAALHRKIRVIPVLVGGARMPGRQDLPEALAPLSRRNAIELSETRFHADVNRLIEAIEKSVAVGEKKTELSATPVAAAKDATTPVKSTQTAQSIPPVASISAIAAFKEPQVWKRRRLIIVSSIGFLLLALAGFLSWPRQLDRPVWLPNSAKDLSDARIVELRDFQLDFIGKFAVPGEGFNAATFDAKLNEGVAKFQKAIRDETFSERVSILVYLKDQFYADAIHLRSKASRGAVTPALAAEMKKDIDRIYDHALGR
jgi:hypothetical protein